MANLKKLPATFYRTAGGNEPVREWLLDFAEDDRRTVGQDIATAEFGWPAGMPLCKAMGHGLFEIRSNLSSSRIARVLFAVVDEQMLLLHGFVKKSRKTPKPDLDLAMKRLKESTT